MSIALKLHEEHTNALIKSHQDYMFAVCYHVAYALEAYRVKKKMHMNGRN